MDVQADLRLCCSHMARAGFVMTWLICMCILQDASSSEIKKAYRKKTLVLHPDKNEAPDAEEKFRKVLKNTKNVNT